ncbi:MAG: glycosyltransferase [Sedimentibacter sp.]|nr:glycosyltransferase [Sedimentibacter sp.]
MGEGQMNMKIKILFIMDHFHFDSGGTERQVYEIIKGLDRSIFWVEACVFRYETNYFKQVKFPCPVFSPEIRSFFDPSTYLKLYRLRKYIQSNKFDIVHIVFNDTAISIPPMMLGLKTKTVSMRRDMGFWYTPMKIMALRINSIFTDLYLANSNSVKENLHQKEWVPLRKIQIISNGVEFSRFDTPKDINILHKLNISKGSPIVGIVANMRPVKRVKDLIHAFLYVEKRIPNSHLIIVGHLGDTFDEYMQIVRMSNIEQKVHFLGMIQDPVPIMKHFTVGVNCSETEGLSNSVIEYMACGVPVVATDTSGNRELILNEVNGLLVPVGKINDLADAIILILEQARLRDRLISKAKENIVDRFASDTIIKQYMMCYHNIIEK